MITVNDDTVMVGATEFRSEMPKLLKLVGQKTIVVMNRGEPVAVFQDYQHYQEDQSWHDTFEDVVLGYLAKERDDASDDKDFISHRDVLKKLNIEE